MNTKNKNIGLIISFLLILMLIWWINAPKEPKEKTVDTHIIYAKILFQDAVKEQMNNPSSFEHVNTTCKQEEGNKLFLIMKFRGTNLFGGVITQTATCTYDMQTEKVSNILIF